MFIWEFLLVFSVSVSSFFAFLMVFREALKAPIIEFHLFSLAFLNIMIGFVLILPSTILYSDNYIDPIGKHFHALSFFFEMLGLGLFLFAFLLPEFQSSHKTYFQMVFISLTITLTAFVNYFTVQHFPAIGKVGLMYHPFGLLLFISCAIIVVIILIKRFNEISQVIHQLDLAFRLPKTTLALVFALLFFIILASITSLIPSLNFPTFSLFLPLTITILGLGYIITKDQTFWFITPTKLDLITIVDKRTGKIRYTNNFTSKRTKKPILTNILSSLSLTVKNLIHSENFIEYISFGDKIILISSGQWVVTFMIVSEKNFITQSLSNFITKKFELIFKSKLEDLTYFEVDLNRTQFSKIIKEIRSYLPL